MVAGAEEASAEAAVVSAVLEEEHRVAAEPAEAGRQFFRGSRLGREA